jgi:hypothetical protein
VLSIAVAALVAVWLPFSVLYVDALNRRAAAPATVVASKSLNRRAAAPATVVASKSGRTVIVTRTSGGQTLQTSVSATTGKPTRVSAVPVTTRAS